MENLAELQAFINGLMANHGAGFLAGVAVFLLIWKWGWPWQWFGRKKKDG